MEMKIMKRHAALPVLLLLALVFAGCASTGETGGTIRIEGHSAYEDCFTMKPGDSMDYAFESQGPLDFNIHYHEGGQVIYPVSKTGVTSEKGTCEAETTNYYCLMWTNPHGKPVWLGYSCEVK